MVEGEAALRDAIEKIYPAGSEAAIHDQLVDRPHWFRVRYVPWIDAVVPLEGKRVLEIGCGTGASTIAFAERGAIIDGIDLHSAGVDFTILRAAVYGVSDRVRAHVMNATEIGSNFDAASFDLVIFTASLEHMTCEERIAALSAAWKLKKDRGYLGILDTPNRLWYFDNHTSDMNFFHWLPDDLAIQYASRSKRADFSRMTLDCETLARQGRGASYHEIEIALGQDIGSMTVHGEWSHQRRLNPDWAKALDELPYGRYHSFLRSIEPNVPKAFLEEEIAVLMRTRGPDDPMSFDLPIGEGKMSGGGPKRPEGWKDGVGCFGVLGAIVLLVVGLGHWIY